MASPPTTRRSLRAARRALSKSEQKRHARRVAERLRKERVFLRARRIAFYWPADGELDPRPLMISALAAGKECYLPLLRPKPGGRRGGKLWLARYEPGARLAPNRFGIPEPLDRRRLPPWHLDLLLMPLVGFDLEGHRIGMGGGFYDRTLAYLNRPRIWRRPRLVGIAHACQRLERITPHPWDVTLDGVVTELAFHRMPRSRPGFGGDPRPFPGS